LSLLKIQKLKTVRRTSLQAQHKTDIPTNIVTDFWIAICYTTVTTTATTTTTTTTTITDAPTIIVTTTTSTTTTTTNNNNNNNNNSIIYLFIYFYVLNSHPKAKYKVSACKETNKTNTCIQT
jgi:hypothetical protein